MPPKSDRPRRSRTYRFHDDLLDALESLAEANRRTVTSELEIAVEKHLAEQGLWPPKSGKKPAPRG